MKTLFRVLALLMLGFVLMNTANANAQGNILQQADAAYNEKSYARALQLYRQAQNAKAVPAARQDDVPFRIAVSLGATQKWDEAFEAGETFLGKTEWKARVLYWLGRLYTQVPHQGYKVNGKIYRGEDYPKIAGAEKPEQVWLSEEDAQKTLEYFEKAKVAAQVERDNASRRDYLLPIYPLSGAEEIDLNFDLAAFLAQREYSKYIQLLDEGKTLDENINLREHYNSSWHLPKKVLYLYNEIPTLDIAENKHDSALSLLAKGLFLRSYKGRMDQWANKWDEKQNKYVKRPYPFDDAEPLASWQQLVRQHRNDPVAPQTQILIAQTWQQRGDNAKALAAYQQVIALFPKTKWVTDARANIQRITQREIALDTLAPQPPGKNAQLNITTRNIKTVNFAAYRVKLEDVLTQAGKLQSPAARFTEFSENFGSIENARKFFGPRVAQWTLQTKDKGNYEGVTETISAPIQDVGAYVIVADAGSVRFARVLILSDLALIKKTDRNRSFVYVADARTGAPVNGANVVLKETYYNNGQKSDVARGKSDDAGFFEKKTMRGKDVYSSNVSAFAWLGDRYAMTGQGGGHWYGYGDNRDEMKIFSYTERPVYRPGQKVHFRQILTKRIAGADQAPSKNTKVVVTVSNPKGEEIWKQELTTGEFGTINASFDLPEGAPLGEYSINAHVPQTTGNIAASGGNRFRVEEYKRPEFQVTVDAPKQAVRPGETVAAKVNVRYYFGSPVPNAKVKYTVRRSTWWANYRFPRPFSWLYEYWGEGDYGTGRRNIGGEGSGAIVKEGETTTDAQGNAEVTFQTERDNASTQDEWWRRYANPLYTIEIEATDASRRTIEGQGSVRVADQQYFAFLDIKRGFYTSGDRVEAELVTRDANDNPVVASGKMVVYKLLPGDKEEKLFEQTVRTDEKGRLFWTWPSDNTGTFRIAFEATDAWGQKVEASQTVWINGPGINNTQIRLQGITIVLDKRNYEEGDTIRALLVADKPDTTVMLTQEVGGDILRRDVIRIAGKSREVQIPVVHGHVPNFAIAAAAIRDFEVYSAQAEVFVPPVRQLMNVSVTGDKETYKPGETGRFTIKATDWQGKPARGEFSLALTDASLFYIQKDYAPDMRAFYYGERRPISVNLDSSRSGRPEGRIEDDNKYSNYETHSWELPDDLGKLNLDPGAGWWGGYYNYDGAMPRRQMRSRAVNGAANEAMTMADAMAPAAAPMMAAEGAAGGMAKSAAREERQDSSQLATAEIRSNFAETALWSPAVVTQNGTATVEVKFPDSLTQWHATARGLTETVQVGSAEHDVETKKNLLVRLQAPRFFTERDQVILSANVHNYLKTDKRVKVSLQLSDALKLNLTRIAWPVEGGTLASLESWINVKAGEEARVNWVVDAVKDGDASVQMTAQSDEESDAVRMNFPVLVHGVQRFAAQGGVMRDKNSEAIKINFPKERRFGASTLNLQMNPSLAATMLDALPYLADYPYGCVEQTMSRFMPSAIVAKTLSESGINLSTLRTRAKALAAEAKTKPIGERVKNTGYTYPQGQPNARDLEQMAGKMWRTDRWNNPVYDEAELQRMINEGLQRLYTMQRSDGGWGWWQGSSQSDPYMSAYVVYGLATAKAADVRVRDDVLNRGYEYLNRQLKDEDNLQLLTYIAYALSQRGAFSGDAQTIVGGRLYEQRSRLAPYSQALLAMALWNGKQAEKARVLVRNLENTAIVDEANATARWKTLDRQWWYWWNNEVETNAVVLRALLTIDSQNRLVPMITKWLTLQARGNHWRSTKETAEAVLSLAQYVRQNRELDVDYTLTVKLNNNVQRTYRVNRDNVLLFDNRFIVGDLFLQDGDNTLSIQKSGRGNVYWNAYSEYFSLEEPIKASGNEMAIQRRYFKLTRKTAEDKSSEAAEQKPAAAVAKRGILPRPIPQPQEPEYNREEIKDGDQLQSGDLVEVELIIDAKNDYEYLVFEDMKAAGLEPVDVRSGHAWGDGLSSNVELRDEKVALFVDRLPQGTRVLRYRMRAEIPGRFHALPTNGYAMYAPEVRAISDEMRVNVRD